MPAFVLFQHVAGCTALQVGARRQQDRSLVVR